MKTILHLLLLLLLLGGCSSEPPISEETLLDRYQTSSAERDEIRERLQSTNLKEVYQGLNQILKKPQTVNLYREEIIRLNKTSQDPKTVQMTTEILNRY